MLFKFYTFSVIAVVTSQKQEGPPAKFWLDIETHTHTHVHKHTLTSKEDKQACYSHYEVLRSKTDWVSRQRRLAGKGDLLGVFMVIRE